MNIIVCVKQVPGTNKVAVDPVTGVLIRDGVESKLNPYDLYALETAYTLAEQTDGKVKALSMGPPQAKAALSEAIWMGADEAALLSDRKFGGADVFCCLSGKKRFERSDAVFQRVITRPGEQVVVRHGKERDKEDIVSSAN